MSYLAEEIREKLKLTLRNKVFTYNSGKITSILETNDRGIKTTTFTYDGDDVSQIHVSAYGILNKTTTFVKDEYGDMEAGEFENRKAFEEVTTKNVRTGIEYSTDTRKLFRELEIKIEHLEKAVRSQSEVIEGFKIQLAGVQTKLFGGGTD